MNGVTVDDMIRPTVVTVGLANLAGRAGLLALDAGSRAIHRVSGHQPVPMDNSGQHFRCMTCRARLVLDPETRQTSWVRPGPQPRRVA